MSFTKYGKVWDDETHPIEVERWMIQQGGDVDYLFEHYMEMRRLVWPHRYRHAWTELIYRQILSNQMTFFMGCASSQKTSHISEWALLKYWCFPENCCVLVSTVNKEKLEMAIFGEIKSLWQAGRDVYPHLAGNLIDYKCAIATDNIEEDDTRDMRKGILGKSCYVGSRYVGLGNFAGIKQEHFVFVADELQFMAATFLDCLPNMLSNTGAGGLKVIGSGNPKHDPEDQLGIACEPLDGWSTVENVTKTTVWQTKFGTCVNLVGTDSPNFHAPAGIEPYPRLIGPRYAADISRIWGKDSPEYEKQVMGRMKLGLSACRVITRQLCREHNAQDEVLFDGSSPLTRIYAIDPAYGGGDRCMKGYIEFGRAMNGRNMVKIYPPSEIKINLTMPLTPEMQISRAVKLETESLGIAPNNIFYDSFGKGTMGFAFAQEFGANSPIPIDSGGPCSKRPVRDGLFVDERGSKRLKTCNEHYSKFVTEMWFSVRYGIEANQIGGLTEDIMHEGCMRVYTTVAGNKIEVEPKADMKERLGGKSPDKFDWLALCIEGARQRGFIINKLGIQNSQKRKPDWLDKAVQNYGELQTASRLRD